MKFFKKISIILFILFLSSTLIGQGIEFFHGSFDEALEKAKVENKLIFVDFYTSWCGPCKQMTKDIFPLEEVGNFYNEHFVCCKVDAEKGEGIALAKKYGIRGYPTFLFADANGNSVHSGIGGKSVEKFIELGKIALDPSKRLNAKKEKFESGKMSREEVLEYLNTLLSAGGNVTKVLNHHLSSLSEEETYSEETFKLIKNYAIRFEEEAFQFLITNREKYYPIVGKKKIEYFIYSKYRDAAFKLKSRGKSYENVMTNVSKNGFDYTERIGEYVEMMSCLILKKNAEQFIEKSKAYLQKHSSIDTKLNTFKVAAMFFIMVKGLDEYVLQLKDELLAADKNLEDDIYDSMGYGYLFGEKYEEALNCFNKIKVPLSNHTKKVIETIKKKMKHTQK